MAWTPEQLGVGVGTSDRPALAVFNGRLFELHKGVPGDDRLFYSSFDGTAWSGEQPMGAWANSSTVPSLAVFNGRLFAAWKGVEGDNAMWVSSFDGTQWSGAQKGIGFATSDGPTLAVFNGSLFGAHTGEPGDNRMWYSRFDGNTWSPEHSGIGTGTSSGPSLAAFNGRLFAAWKGVPNDTRMFYSSYPGNPSISLSRIPGEDYFVNASGQGFTHDDTVAVTYDVSVDATGAFTQGTPTIPTDDNGAFVLRIPEQGTFNSGTTVDVTVKATDNDSLESATASASFS
jgi:hypothetical protein